MTLETLREYCLSLPYVSEDIKWGNDLCFCIGGKMFCITGLVQPIGASLKVPDEEFDELCSRNGIKPAAYLARYKWIYVEDLDNFSVKEWKHYLKQSYEMKREKLSPKLKKTFGIPL